MKLYSLNMILFIFTLLNINICHSQEFKETENVIFLLGQLQVSLPSNFSKLTRDIIELKYPYSNNSPQEVYSDEFGKVNFTASLRENMPTEPHHLNEVKEVLVNNIQQNNITIIKEGFTQIDDKKFVLIEFTSEGVDEMIYNIMYASSLKGKLLIGNFNFPNMEFVKWYDRGLNTIKSMLIPLNE